MKKIAMLTFLKANRVCTGAACFQAFHEQTRGFEISRGQQVQVAAFMKCNGCDSDPIKDEGMREKVERLKKEQVEAVHLGACTIRKDGSRCENIARIAEMIREQGIVIMDKTHNP